MAETEKLSQLIYVSKMSPETISHRDDVVIEIINSSVKNNLSRNLTGMLLVYEESFMQLLEGQSDQLRIVVETIFADKRHDEPELLYQAKASKRMCPEWQMCMPELSATEKAIGRSLELANFSPFQISGRTAFSLFEWIASHFRSVQTGAPRLDLPSIELT